MSDAVPYEHLTPDVIIDAGRELRLRVHGQHPGARELREPRLSDRRGRRVRRREVLPARPLVDGRDPRGARVRARARGAGHSRRARRSSTTARSLRERDGYRFAVYERRGGRWPELGTSEDREWLGRFLGRIHAVGAHAAVHGAADARSRGDGRARGGARARRRLAAAAPRHELRARHRAARRRRRAVLRGGRRLSRAAHSRRLPSQQRAVDRRRAALRRSRRLHERPGRAGPVAVPRGLARRDGRAARRSARGLRQVRGLRLPRAAA